MRPVCLKLSAFGSYAGETVIDFGNVREGVFLITGDTGAGKTTIFDGIMYALYGSTSGGRRDGAMMRSQYAGSDTKTYVELEFENHGIRYRVVRNPAYERESKRKGKDGTRTTTMEKANVELYFADGSMFVGNRQETNRKIEEILGVDSNQFSQIVMIAQGEFLRLLLAKSDERKEIFSKIFDTRIYGAFQEKLKEKTKTMAGRLEDNLKACLREMSQLESDECREEIQFLLEKSQKEPDMEKALEMADRFVKTDQDAYKKVNQEMKDSRERLEKKMQLFSLGKERMEVFTQLEKTNAQWENLLQQKKFWEEKKDALQRAKRAISVVPYEMKWEQEEKQEKDLQDRIQQLEQWFAAEKNGIEKKREEKEHWEQEKSQWEETKRPVYEEKRKSLDRFETVKGKILEGERLEKEVQKKEKEYQEANEKYCKQAEEYETMYQAYVQEQAGILAQTLKEDVPCPVCGSLHHPKKAVLSKEAPTKEQVTRSRMLRNQAEKKRMDCQESWLNVSKKFMQLKAVLEENQKEWMDFSDDDSFSHMLLNLQRWQKDTVLLVQSIAKEYREIQEQYSKAADAYEKTVKEQNIRKGQMEETQGRIQRQKILTAKAREHFLLSLQQAGFSDRNSYQKAKMPDEEIQQQEYLLEEYEHQKVALQEKIGLLSKQVEGKNKPELPALEQEVEEEKQYQQTLELQGRKLYSRKEKNQHAQNALKRLEKERTDLREEFQILSNISKTANGSLAGSAKIDFVSYIQRQYFEQMIRCANQHLQKMAAGQFLLQCRSLDQLSTQGNAGLDLDVYSMVTGKTRDVKTLSGGESFMAALALALGMTDIITSSAGAVKVETLFIDEGFGSLDENAREQAIRILQGLAGGNRLVGIISHVTELKEQIDQKLIVTKTKTGSHAAWK